MNETKSKSSSELPTRRRSIYIKQSPLKFCDVKEELNKDIQEIQFSDIVQTTMVDH